MISMSTGSNMSQAQNWNFGIWKKSQNEYRKKYEITNVQ